MQRLSRIPYILFVIWKKWIKKKVMNCHLLHLNALDKYTNRLRENSLLEMQFFVDRL